MNFRNDSQLQILNSIEEEIYGTSLDLSIDFIDIGIDTLSSSDLIKEIPIVKTLFACYELSSSINSRYNIKKILVFLQQFHTQNIDNKKLKKFKSKLEKDVTYKLKVLETTLALIENFIDIQKSKILANLLTAHIEEHLSWEDYMKLSFVLKQLNPHGYKFLFKSFDKQKVGTMDMSQKMEGEAFLLSCGIAILFKDELKITKTGEKLYFFGLKNLSDDF